MKNFGKSIALGIAITSLSASAQTATTSEKNWAVESTLQFHSMASSGNTMFGPGLFYNMGQSHQLGLKTLLSVGSPGVYQATLAFRHLFGREKSRVFAELGASYNLINFSKHVGSVGLAAGFLHNITEDLSIGGNAGFEFFGRDGPVSGYMKIGNSIHFTPKASLIVSVDF